MNSSNRLLHDFSSTSGMRGDPGFVLIVAFDYYDGPEKGFALFPSGVGVRFSSLGDSRSRLFRAFELVPIEGDWWPRVRALQEAITFEPSNSRVVVPAESGETLTLLERDVFNAAMTGCYVSVGSPNLDWLGVSPVTSEQLETLRQLGNSSSGFHSTHQIIKKKLGE